MESSLASMQPKQINHKCRTCIKAKISRYSLYQRMSSNMGYSKTYGELLTPIDVAPTTPPAKPSQLPRASRSVMSVDCSWLLRSIKLPAEAMADIVPTATPTTLAAAITGAAIGKAKAAIGTIAAPRPKQLPAYLYFDSKRFGRDLNAFFQLYAGLLVDPAKSP
uniref:Uncharacterized protein n=1 Tax=Glossina brevipalpis TaxID=37001 RepID=A0A1A9WDH2_9MUSC